MPEIAPSGLDAGAQQRPEDWAATPLGPRARWPGRLRAVVDLVLASPLPSVVLWGTELVQFYNDCCARMAGTKHPGALGQPMAVCAPDAWHLDRAVREAVFRGEARILRGRTLTVHRHGVAEDACFDVTCSPVPEEDGSAAGILVTFVEATAGVAATRQRQPVSEGARGALLPAGENDARYRALFEATDQGFLLAEVLFDAAGHAVDVLHLEANPAAARLIGFDIAGRRLSEIQLGCGRSWIEMLAGVARTGEAARFEHHVAAIGHWYDTYAFAPSGGDGSGPRVAILFRDVTERRRAEEALRDSEARLRALVDATSDVLYRMSPDWAEMRALSGGGFLEDTAAADRDWLRRYIHPDDQPAVLEAIGAAIRERRPFAFEHRVRLLDGGLGWTHSRAAPILGADGEVVEWFGAASDVTARRRAEEALRVSEERWRGVYTNMQEGFALCEIVYGADGRAVDFRYIEVNDAVERLSGIPRAAIAGRLASEAIPGIEPFWTETYARVVETGEAAHFEHHVAAIGRWFEVFAYRTALGRFAALFLNVTERKAAEERQALLSREVDHRAKNALAVVQAALRLTRAPDLPSYARAIEGRVSALARAQTLLAEDQWAGADLGALLAGELAAFLDAPGEDTPRVDLAGPPVALPAGAAQPLAMAVHELATNAVKHGALSVPAGRVAVSWSLEGGPWGRLRLRWTESGGPPVPGPPGRRGFGSRVLDGTLRRQLGGTMSLAWAPSGLACEMEVPMRGPAAASAPAAGLDIPPAVSAKVPSGASSP